MKEMWLFLKFNFPAGKPEESKFTKIVERYQEIFKLKTNHAGEEVTLSIIGNRVLFHAEKRDEPYQAGVLKIIDIHILF